MAFGQPLAGPLEHGDDHLTTGPVRPKRPEQPGEAGPDGKTSTPTLSTSPPHRSPQQPTPLSDQRGELRSTEARCSAAWIVAAATIHRLVHHAEVIALRGPTLCDSEPVQEPTSRLLDAVYVVFKPQPQRHPY